MHEVQAKESLYSLARKYDVKPAEIAAANGFDKDKSLILGEKIKIPATAKKASENNNTTTAKTSKTKISGQAVITGSNINIRKGPATNEEVVGIAQQGDVIDVIKKVNDEWASIRTKDGLEGYIASQFLQAPQKFETPKKAAAVKKVQVAGTNINIRKGPNTTEEIVGTAQQDNVVDLIKNIDNEWALIRTQDGVEGYIASRFLQPVGTVNKKAESNKTVQVTGTNINIRQGPATDQPVIGVAQQGDVFTAVKTINNEWTEVRTADGNAGFIASQFLLDEAAAKAREEKIDNVVEKIEERVKKEPVAETKGLGYFKKDYANKNNIDGRTVMSGIFKTDRGWKDGRYYILMDDVAAGTVVKLSNPAADKIVYAKVLGDMKSVKYSDGFDIRISEAAAAVLGISATDKFNVAVSY